MKTKNLIVKLGQLQEEITKASLPVSADLSNDFTSIILKTDQSLHMFPKQHALAH